VDKDLLDTTCLGLSQKSVKMSLLGVLRCELELVEPGTV
jgi:hypothetical protein